MPETHLKLIGKRSQCKTKDTAYMCECAWHTWLCVHRILRYLKCVMCVSYLVMMGIHGSQRYRFLLVVRYSRVCLLCLVDSVSLIARKVFLCVSVIRFPSPLGECFGLCVVLVIQLSMKVFLFFLLILLSLTVGKVFRLFACGICVVHHHLSSQH